MPKICRVCLPIIQTVVNKGLSLLIALSIVTTGLGITPTSSVTASSPKMTPPAMDAHSEQYGSNWNQGQPNKPAALLSEQLAALQAAPKLTPIHIELEAEPAIYIPGVPITISWTIRNFDKLDLKSSPQLVFTTQKGVLPQDNNLAKQFTSNYSISTPVTEDSGMITWTIDSTAITPIYVSVQLMVNDKKIDDNAVMIDAAQFEISKSGINNRLTPQRQTVIEPNKNPINITAPTGASDEDLSFSIHNPSPNHLPPMSLTGNPVEILAVGKSTFKNVKKFNKPLNIQIKYDPKAHPNWNEDDLQLFYYDPVINDWYPMATTVDKVNKTLSTQSDHLTIFDYKMSSWQGYTPPTVDSFKVSDFTGAGDYSLNFWVPPAPGSLAPSLSLNYNSQIVDESAALTQSSWVGAGWNLDTGSITRNMHSTNGDTSDDTFNISAGGISGQLLPVSTSGTVTTYNTTSQSYTRVIFDSSNNTWKAYDKNGTIYGFSYAANLDKDDACGTPNLTWKWSLTSVTDINGKSLTYTYTTDKKTACSSGQQSDIAVYPQTVTYSNSQYRINFVTESRNDYQTSWTTNTSKILYGTQRLQRIQVQMLSGGSWTNIRQYVFSYLTTVTNGIDDPVFPSTTYTNNSGKILTLGGVQEIGSDGSTNLPATQFRYADKIHLTRVTNGQGGQVDMTYERITFYDQVNKDVREISTIFGTDECNYSNGIGTSWTPNIGTVRCDPGDASPNGGRLQVGALNSNNNGIFGSGLRSLPEGMVKPGDRYRLGFNVRPLNSGSTGVNYGMVDTTNQNTVFYSLSGLNSSSGWQETSRDMPVDFNAATTKLQIDCDQCFVRQIGFVHFVTYYRVLTRVVADNVTGVNGTYTYHYDEEAPNTPAVSEAVAAGGTVYNTSMSEFRGHAMSDVIDPQGLATVNFYYQNDTLKGNRYHSLNLNQTFYDDLNWTSINPSSWTTSGSIGLSGIDYITNYAAEISSSTTTNATMLRANPINGNMAFGQIRINSADANTQGEVGLVSSGGKFFGVIAKPVSGGTGVYVRTNTGGGLQDSSTALIPAGTFNLNKWYGVLLIMDNTNGFKVRMWQMGDLNNTVYESMVSGYASDTWKLRAQANSGNLWFDTPLEGTLFSESTTKYNSTTQFAHGVLATSSLQQYTDLNVVWTTSVESISRNYDGKSTWFGTRTTSDYNTADQNGSQYGNSTRVVYSSWNGSVWVDDHASKIEFFPLDNGTKYLVGLPARSLVLGCSGSASDGSDCDFTGNTALLGETLNIYDTNSAYNSSPSSGLLAKQRVLLDDSSGTRLYGETGYTYDGWGNQTIVTTYNEYAYATISPTSGAQTDTRQFDPTFNTYVVSESNILGHTTLTDYDYSKGVPNKVTDPNGSITSAGYDGNGRMTSVIAPGDNPTNPTLKVDYYNFSSSTSPFKVVLTQKLDDSNNMQNVRFYNGLGQLIQSQTLNADVNGPGKNIVQDTKFDILGRATQQTKPYTYSGSYAFQSQSFSQPKTTTQYDLLSRVLEVLDANGTHTDTTYSGLTTSQTDPNGNITGTITDVWGRVVNVTPPSGPGLTYSYDKTGRLTSVIKGSGGSATTTTLGYDKGGRKTSMSDPDMGNWTYKYDALSSLKLQTDARGCTTTIGYDNLERPNSKTYAGPGACSTTSPISYIYDGNSFSFLGNNIGTLDGQKGQRTGMVDNSGVTVWTFDGRGRKVSENKQIYQDDAHTMVQSFNTGWQYNSADLPVTMTYPDGETDKLGYNAQGELNSLKKNDNSFTYVKNLTYDEAGRITNLGMGDNGGNSVLSKSYNYFSWTTADSGGRLSNMSATNSAGVNLQNLNYTTDKNGNITSINNLTAGETSAFGYDNINRLTSSNVTANQGGTNIYLESFNYDPTTGGLASRQTNNSALQFYSYDAAHKNAVSNYNNNTYTYDANGNQVQRNLSTVSSQLVYDAENRLIEVIPSLSPTATVTASITPTPTLTPTETPTITDTGIATISSTPTTTISDTPTILETSEESLTATTTGSVTETLTPTLSSPTSVTPDQTETNTPSLSATVTPMASLTLTALPTDTMMASSTNTSLPPSTATASLTSTSTTVPSSTATLTVTNSLTPSKTLTPSSTNTATNTFTPSITSTSTITLTPTKSNTPTITNTSTITPTFTPTRTNTATPTFIAMSGNISLCDTSKFSRSGSVTQATYQSECYLTLQPGTITSTSSIGLFQQFVLRYWDYSLGTPITIKVDGTTIATLQTNVYGCGNAGCIHTWTSPIFSYGSHTIIFNDASSSNYGGQIITVTLYGPPATLTPTITNTSTITPTATPSLSPTATATVPTATATLTFTPTKSLTPSATSTFTATVPTSTPSLTSTQTKSTTPTLTATNTASPTASLTVTATLPTLSGNLSVCDTSKFSTSGSVTSAVYQSECYLAILNGSVTSTSGLGSFQQFILRYWDYSQGTPITIKLDGTTITTLQTNVYGCGNGGCIETWMSPIFSYGTHTITFSATAGGYGAQIVTVSLNGVVPTATLTSTSTSSVTASPTSGFSPTASLSATASPNVSATATNTSSPIVSPTISPTGPTPTATAIPTEPTPEPISDAKYIYDGDGNMVKSVSFSTLGSSTTTYYPGKHYNKEVKDSTEKIQKYYYAGSTLIAVRNIVNGTDTLQWMVSDNLGSTSVTANADGSWNSEIRYTAFGETRWKSGITAISYRYTGQLEQANIGLDYYGSRFYDPILTRFVQPDSMVPNGGSFKSYDHYAYVQNNPILFNDPSGHMICDGEGHCGGKSYQQYISKPVNPFQVVWDSIWSWWDGENVNYQGSGGDLGHGVRQVLGNTLGYGANNKAETFGQLIIRSLCQYDSTEFSNGLVDVLKYDPQVAENNKYITNYTKSIYKSDYGKINFSYVYYSSKNPDSWDLKDHPEGNYIFFGGPMPSALLQWGTYEMRSAHYKARVDVSNQGVLSINYSVNDILDLRPEPYKDARYNWWATNFFAPLYHDILGGNDKMTTTANWTNVINP